MTDAVELSILRRPRRAACDPQAFYPFRGLVKGPFTDLNELEAVERFIRAVVLHDCIRMELERNAFDPRTDNLAPPGPRNVIVAIGPIVNEYEIFEEQSAGEPLPKVVIPTNLLDVVRRFSNAEPGNVYYKAHIEYLQRLVSVCRDGGSVVCEGEVGTSAFEAASTVPEELFTELDSDWQHYVNFLAAGDVGPLVPPVLAIVLSRCRGREDVPRVVRELRDEWAEARWKIWSVVDELHSATTLRQITSLRSELTEASKALSPDSGHRQPLRALWSLV